uniref:Uncharacterized protein n=1 Tax=Amphilophus citrinellus TaxID=61819 RepID=A0A3Q0SU62_AMPCI
MFSHQCKSEHTQTQAFQDQEQIQTLPWPAFKMLGTRVYQIQPQPMTITTL